jgi:hypothetical protein
MPFTLCHPALAIPIHRCAPALTSLSALAIGSMTPDFVYFFPLGVSGSFSHSWLGLILYCVPAGALVFAFYHALARDAFIACAPQAIAARMPVAHQWPMQGARAVWVALVSLGIGAASHIVWDAFTHADTAVVNYFTVLRSPVSLGAVALPLYKVLQHTSTLLGFVVIAVCTARWIARTPPALPSPRRLSTAKRFAALGIIGLAGAAGGLAGLMMRPTNSIEHALFNMVVTGMAAAALATVMLCVGLKIARSRAAD